jgi:NAD(P)-dependent dehydrogenase (short-subunit alcohol dehydrogenase family)
VERAEPAEVTAGTIIRFDDRVAIVTGAGNGLGRCHALGLAARGAKVVVNDAGGTVDGTGRSAAAERVVAEIAAAGGIAIADTTDVTDPAQVVTMAERTYERWGRIDILVNNAGILRDKSFAKLSLEDFRAVIEVHVMGAFHTAKAVWDGMRAQNYGRIVFTTSSSGLYGNFGQANYGTAKAALVGLMKVLDQEGRKSDIRVNLLSPTAATRRPRRYCRKRIAPSSIRPASRQACSISSATTRRRASSSAPEPAPSPGRRSSRHRVFIWRPRSATPRRSPPVLARFPRRLARRRWRMHGRKQGSMLPSPVRLKRVV